MEKANQVDRRALKDRIRALTGRGAHAKALALFAQLLTIDSEDPMVRMRHAECLQRLGHVSDAIVAYKTAAKLFEADARVTCARAALGLARALAPFDASIPEWLELLADHQPSLRVAPEPASMTPPRSRLRGAKVIEFDENDGDERPAGFRRGGSRVNVTVGLASDPMSGPG